MVIAPISSFGNSHYFTTMCYPLLISSKGIVAFLITTLFAIDIFKIKVVKQIDPALKNKLVISTILMTIGIIVVSLVAFPSSFTIFLKFNTPYAYFSNKHCHFPLCSLKEIIQYINMLLCFIIEEKWK